MAEIASSTPLLPARRRRRQRERSLRRIVTVLFLVVASLFLIALVLALRSVQGESAPGVEALEAQIVPPASLREEWIPYPALDLRVPLVGSEKVMRGMTHQPRLRSGFLFVDPASGQYAGLSAGEAFSAASVIKLPVLVEFFRQVDSGAVRLDETLVLEQSHKGGGSGWLQYRPDGTKLGALTVASLMMIRSDNTATNMIIARLGGAEYVNAQFVRWGLQQTVLREPLPDLDGRNTSSPLDLALLLAELERGDLLSPASRVRAYQILERTRVQTLIKPGLGPGTRIFHKTGDIGKMVGDAGVVLMPDGRRYIATALVERPHNDRRANQLITRLSQQFYRRIATPEAAPPLLSR